MSKIVVYGILGSPFVRVVQMMLEEKHAPYRTEAIPPGSLKTSEQLKRHPFGRVPAIGHGDFSLYETQAILRCLDAVFPDPIMRLCGRPNRGQSGGCTRSSASTTGTCSRRSLPSSYSIASSGRA